MTEAAIPVLAGMFRANMDDNATFREVVGKRKSPAFPKSLEDLVFDIKSGKATINDLLTATRDRLIRLVSVRISPKLGKRVDADDIVQETFVTVAKRFDEYLANPKVPVFVWLRGIAIERMIEAHRFHLGAAKRSANCEQAARKWLDQSTCDLLQRVQANEKSPSEVAVDRQRSSDLRVAMQKLPERYRDILVLRFFESLTVAETAAAIGSTEANAKVLQFRALKKLEEIIGKELNWQSSDRTG